MLLFNLLVNLACVEDINRLPTDFPDNKADDFDGDGLSELQGDCNDLDETVLRASTWYADADLDGFGDPNVSTEACEQPEGYVENSEDCLDTDNTVYPGNARFELPELCVLDLDGDGFGDMLPDLNVDSGTDCDDQSADVNPDMPEVCDGIDNDCNARVDENTDSDAPSWFYDGDQDGFGDPAIVLHACVSPAGYVADNTDCDDSTSITYPSAPEYCDGQDNNCNAIVDESAVDSDLWFIDADGDGYGEASVLELSCTQPENFVSNSEDCNDLSNQQHPDASEVCNGEDDNCDGQIDEAVKNVYFVDGDGDGFGNPLSIEEGCNAEPTWVSNGDDCNDTDPFIKPSAPEVCNFIDDDCNGGIDDNALDALTFYVDSDGDGWGVNTQVQISCPTIVNGLPSPPSGYSFFDDDCDDADANRSPGLPELCTTEIDENCDEDPTLGATDVNIYYADSDGDGQGNALFTVAVCAAPFGYVDNALDCNDTDELVLSGMPEAWEICNGKLDRCEDDDGSLTPPSIERDGDNDGFVDCVLAVDPLQWEDPNSTRPLGEIRGGDCADNNADVFPGNCPLETDPNGCYLDADLDGYGDPSPPSPVTVSDYAAGLDCEDNNPFAYPGAPELCNGIAEDCEDPNYGGSPDFETDNDGDGYVECSGYDSSIWVGDSSVIGGGDCQDGSALIYVGAAYNHPDTCAQDADNDGEPDCNLTGINPTYTCDLGLFLPVGIGPDFVRIPAGDDPLGRYSISYDFYMMTTEFLNAHYNAIYNQTEGTSMIPSGYSNWSTAAYMSNLLSDLMGVEKCYDCQGLQSCSLAVSPLECTGYRLPTEWEWEYAARSGTTEDVWTGQGSSLGGLLSNVWNACYGVDIQDGVNNPSLLDYAWYCGNNSSQTRKSSAQKLPNGFGLYDMHGNMEEWTDDISLPFVPSGLELDPWSGHVGMSTADHVLRGGYFSSYGHSTGVNAREQSDLYYEYRGYRLVIRAP